MLKVAHADSRNAVKLAVVTELDTCTRPAEHAESPSAARLIVLEAVHVRTSKKETSAEMSLQMLSKCV